MQCGSPRAQKALWIPAEKVGIDKGASLTYGLQVISYTQLTGNSR